MGNILGKMNVIIIYCALGNLMNLLWHTVKESTSTILEYIPLKRQSPESIIRQHSIKQKIKLTETNLQGTVFDKERPLYRTPKIKGFLIPSFF